jgi:hypothetical protein
VGSCAMRFEQPRVIAAWFSAKGDPTSGPCDRPPGPCQVSDRRPLVGMAETPSPRHGFSGQIVFPSTLSNK